MHFVALATDYDGTIAEHGTISAAGLAALQTTKRSGRSVVLVTGRERSDLLRVLPEIEIFDLAVLENGAVLYDPATRTTKLLAQPPAPAFFEALVARGIPHVRGQVICATPDTNVRVVLDVVHNLRLDLQIILNKGSAMVLPLGIDKASGLAAAAERLGLSRHNMVAVGDAENDQVLLASAEIGVAVANALPVLKSSADYVTRASNGDGVHEFVAEHLVHDCVAIAPRVTRHSISVGTRDGDGSTLRFRPDGERALVVGPPSAARQELLHAIADGLLVRDYRLLALDTEGDLSAVLDTPTRLRLGPLADANSTRELDHVIGAFGSSATIDVSDLAQDAQTAAMTHIIGNALVRQARSGLPHCVMVNDAHRVIDNAGGSALFDLWRSDLSVALVTCSADAIPIRLLRKPFSLWVAERSSLERTVTALRSAGLSTTFDTDPLADAVRIELRSDGEVSVCTFHLHSSAH